jgi:hypothetical protein
MIVQTAGSNPTLADKKLNIYAAKPFVALSKMVDCLDWLGVRDDVRTPAPSIHRPATSKRRTSKTIDHALFVKHVDAIVGALNEPECNHILPNIRMLKERFGQDGQAAA